MLEIKDKYYNLKYDEAKNRIYFNCMGDWTSREVAPNFMKDWMKVMARCKPGWTILGDLTEVGEFADDAQQYHVEVQQVIMSKGVRKVAQVAGFEMAGTVRAFSKESGLQSVLWAFFSPAHAEKWLDDKIEIDK